MNFKSISKTVFLFFCFGFLFLSGEQAFAVVGQCGEANGHKFLSTESAYTSTYDQCNLGTSTNTTFPVGGTPANWYCNNAGENSPQCIATKNRKPMVTSGTLSYLAAPLAKINFIGFSAYDADSDTLTYAWACDNGGTFTSNAVANPEYIAPATARTDHCTLLVSDGYEASISSTVTVTVNAVPTGTCPTGTNNTFTTPGTCTWIVPLEVTSITVNLCGGGAGGGSGGQGSYGGYYAGSGTGGTGGAAGSCNTSTLSVTPGQTLTIKVGGGGSGGSGHGPNWPLEGVCPAGMTSGGNGLSGYTGDSSTINSTLVVAAGGTNGGAGGAGGSGGGCYGSSNGTPGSGGGAGDASICPTVNGGSGAAGSVGSGSGSGGAGGGGGAGCGGGGGGGGGGAHYAGLGGAGGAGANGVAKITINSVSGTCGLAATKYASTANNFTGSMCSAGSGITNPANPAFPAPGTPTTWTCGGSGGGGASVPCTATQNRKPIIMNGIINYSVVPSGNVNFTGFSAYDLDSGDTLTYSWACTNGGTFTSNAVANPEYIAPATARTDTCRLTVSDALETTQSSVVTVLVSTGECGGANGHNFLNSETDYTITYNQCNAGTPSSTAFPAIGQTVSWTCGTSSCSASRVPPLPQWHEVAPY